MKIVRRRTLESLLDQARAEGISQKLLDQIRREVVTYECRLCKARLPKWQCDNCGWQPTGEPKPTNRG